MSTTDQDIRAERAVVSLESIATTLELLLELLRERLVARKGTSK